MDLLAWASAVVAIAAVVGVGVKAAQFARRVGHFFDDWFGEAERPGVPKRPGAMERLSRLETFAAELRPNGGSTLADAVNRTEGELRATRDEISDLCHVVKTGIVS